MNILETAEGYRALTQDVACVPRSAASRLRFSGTDAAELLDRLSTNGLTGLGPGTGTATVLTTNKGRIIDLLTVSDSGEGLMAIGSAPAASRVLEWIDFYTFDEDMHAADVTEDTFMVGLAGPRAADVVGELAGSAAASLESFGIVRAKVDGIDATVLRSDFLGRAEFDVIVASGNSERLGESIGLAAPAVGPESVEVVRIERCIPAFGPELGEDRNPLEAGLIGSISFNKGCYVGQEVIARLNAYDKVQRRLAVVRSSAGPIAVGDEVIAGDARMGVVTSAVGHPDGGWIGLAYVRSAMEGGEVTLGAAAVTATVTAPDPALSPAG